MDDLCKRMFQEITLTTEHENYSMKNVPYTGNVDIWKRPDYIGCIKLFAYAVIIIGGFLGNTSVISTIILNKSMRNTINFYIANLALADSMICVICMIPHALTVLTGNFFVLGKFMCKFNPFIQMACMTCSVLTLSAISCDRLMAIMFPLRWRFTKHRPMMVIGIVWAISTLVSLPFFIVRKLEIIEWKNFTDSKCTEKWPIVVYYDEISKECDDYEPLKSTYYITVSITLFFMPIVVMIAAYSLILHRLWNNEIIGEQNEANINAHSTSKKKVNKMVFSVLMVFIVCWTPIQFTILYFALKSNQLSGWFTHFEWFSYYIAYANSFINPLIYAGFRKPFRDGFCRILQCGCRRNGRGHYGGSNFSSLLTSIFSRTTSRKKDSKTFNDKKLNHEMISIHEKDINAKESCVSL